MPPSAYRALRALTLKGAPQTQKMPITFDILQRLHSVLPLTNDGVVLRAAMDLAFFGCLRASELCASTNPTGSDYISLRDVCFASSQGIDYLRIRIKSSKTDTTSVGFTVCIGCTRSIVCGHCSVLLLSKASRTLSVPRTPSIASLPASIRSSFNQALFRLSCSVSAIINRH